MTDQMNPAGSAAAEPCAKVVIVNMVGGGRAKVLRAIDERRNNDTTWIARVPEGTLLYDQAALDAAVRAALSAAPLPKVPDDDKIDAERWRWVEEHATSTGGGQGFTLSVFVPHDIEDWGCAIDAARGTE